jgi:CheY-like chemotaxis protein
MAAVLIVDDEEMIRTLASMILKSAGYQVLTAANGVEGVALYRSYAKRIDLVITDLKMPVMDGYRMVRLIRETNGAARIICMSGFADEEIPQGVMFLSKPFGPDKLLASVAKVLG